MVLRLQRRQCKNHGLYFSSERPKNCTLACNLGTYGKNVTFDGPPTSQCSIQSVMPFQTVFAGVTKNEPSAWISQKPSGHSLHCVFPQTRSQVYPVQVLFDVFQNFLGGCAEKKNGFFCLFLQRKRIWKSAQGSGR